MWFVPEEVQAREESDVEKDCKKQKKAGATCWCPRGKTGEFILPLSFLLLPFLLCSFCPKFSSFSSSPPHLCFRSYFFCHCPASSSPTCLSLCQYVSLFPLCALLPHYPLTACHPVTSPCLLYSQLLSLSPYLCNSVTPPLLLPPYAAPSVCLYLCSQLTSATRRCSCARTAGHATRTRSASVLRSLRGCCANTPAARQARTATGPLPCTSPRPPCCSALCSPTCWPC